MTAQHGVFPPVPWPAWIGRPEPEFLKHLPGGLVTAGTVVIIVLGLLWQIGVCIARCCRKKRSIDHHDRAAQDAGGAAALAGCIGPKLVLVFTQEEECKAPSACCTPLLHPESPVRKAALKWLRSPEHLICVPLSFPEGSDLHKHEVWVVGITEESLEQSCERFQRQKLVDTKKVEEKFHEFARKPRRLSLTKSKDDAFTATDSEGWARPLQFQQDCAKVEHVRLMDRLHDPSGKFNIWLPFTKKRMAAGLFRQPKDWQTKKRPSASGAPEEKKGFFSPSEVINTIMNVLGHAQDDEGRPVFLAAFEVGEIMSGFPVVDREVDQREFEEVLRSWKTILPWRKPPTEDLARLFGPSVAVYFTYMQMYLTSLTLPALCVVASLVWHLQNRSADLNLEWGAAFGEGWSQVSFALCLTMWSTLFFLQWRTRIQSEVYRLGQDQLHKDVHSIDGCHMYFKRRGFKLSKKRGIYRDRFFRPRESGKMCHMAMTYVVMFVFLSSSCLIIAGLCWISDKASMVTYSENEKLDELLKNVISVASYLVISTPLQGVWNRLTTLITSFENRKETSEFVDRLVRRKAFFVLVNYMGWFLYLGFFSQNVVALRSQLMVFFILKPSGLLGTFVELLSLCRTKHKKYERHQLLEMVEREWKKEPPNLFDEYLEVTIIFAAALLFAPVFPEGLIIAVLHTFFEYIADKVKLYYYLRIQLPLTSDFFAISAWAEIWQGLSWVAIFVSSWLVNVFLKKENISEQKDTWDPDDEFKWDRILLQGLPSDQQRVITIVLLEHFLIMIKAYLNITVSGDSKEVDVHREVVHKVLNDGQEVTDNGMPDFTKFSGVASSSG